MINRILHKRHFSFVNGCHQIHIRKAFFFILSWILCRSSCSFNFEPKPNTYESHWHIITSKRWSIMMMVQFSAAQFAFDAMAYDVHVSDILFHRMPFFRVFDCNQQRKPSWSVFVHFLALATILWVHLMTKMKSNRLYRKIIRLLNILCLLWRKPTHVYIIISHNQCHLYPWKSRLR